MTLVLSQPTYPLKAIAVLLSDQQQVTGTVTFTQAEPDEGTDVVAAVQGLEPGTLHGLHVHETGDLSGGCETLGEHYNPYHQLHGGPYSKVRHTGDFGNVQAGRILYLKDIKKLQLASILGRGVVLHAGQDDLGKGESPLSKTTGNSGARLACGVIVAA